MNNGSLGVLMVRVCLLAVSHRAGDISWQPMSVGNL